MTETESFKNVSVISYVEPPRTNPQYTVGGQTFLLAEWDMEITFSRKLRPGDRVRESGDSWGPVGTIIAVFTISAGPKNSVWAWVHWDSAHVPVTENLTNLKRAESEE